MSAAADLRPVAAGAHQVPRTFDGATALMAVCATMMLLPSSLVVPGFGGIGRPTVLIGLAVLIWWGVALVAPHVDSPQPSQPLRLAVALYVVALWTSYAAGARTLPTGIELRAMDRSVIATMAMIGIMLLAAEGITHTKRLDRLINVTVVCGTIMAAIGVVQFATEIDVAAMIQVPGLQSLSPDVSTMGERSGYTRVSGTAIHPIEFAVVLTTLLPLVLHRAFWSSTPVLRACAWAGVLLMAGAVALTISRTAVVGLAVAGVVLALGWSWPRRIGVAVLAGGFLAAMQAFVPGLIGTMYGLFTNWEHDPSVSARTRELAEIDVALRDHPWLGRGPRTYVPELHGYIDNQYLLTLIEQGLLGVVAVLLLLGVCVWLAVRASSIATDRRLVELNRSLLAAVMVVVVSFATYDGLSFPMASGLAFLVFGMVGAAHRLSRSQRQRTARGATA